MQQIQFPRTETFLWYDLETFGLNTRYDRIAQFAARRTDMNLKPIGDPIVLFGKVSDDYLPDPLACLVTGITPDDNKERGLCEEELIRRINEEFSVPRTIVCGFNNIKFDDEMVRSTLYRNFFDPYEREWKNGCSRWDIIDLVRAAHDLRPDGINWPPKNPETGNPVFKLTELTAANHIEQVGAHDAMVDVNATIAIARLIKEKQPRLFSYALNHRSKEQVKRIVTTPFGSPFLLTATRFTNPNGCSELVLPITPTIDIPNTFICFDLSKDPMALISAKDDYSSVDGLFSLAVNRCPFVTELRANFPSDEAFTRLGIDKQKCLRTSELLREHPLLIPKLRIAKQKDEFPVVNDTDFAIYSGGFFSDNDKKQFDVIHTTKPDERLSLSLKFEDVRIQEMLFRQVSRNYPEALTETQKKQWKSFCANRILNPPGNVMINWDFFNRKVDERLSSNETTPQQKLVLSKLKKYGSDLAERIFV